MELREIVKEKLTFGIKRAKEYKEQPFCTWEELIATKGLLPDDIIDEFKYDKIIKTEPGFACTDDPDNYPKTYYAPSVVVVRPRLENDEEYSNRMKRNEHSKKETEEREKLEYLRLKAKFEK